MKYQILSEYNLYGKTRVCACTEPTKSGSYCYTYTEDQAKQRVEELNAIGVKAWYETFENAWFED